ncbi:endo alpha-1,4 polygalactosaminidase [Solicola sp. PLA-1-18]|uniref:endo alpha-1,4 polygalactosaminidase n=1 Tax=Solicola sp. PLA-1-18 TaxID=3380532 RepID=UPI003B82AB4D
MLKNVVRVAALVLLVGLLSSPPAQAASSPEAPPVAGRVDYQLGGAYKPARGVDVVVRDRTSKPARGRYSICYVNAFQTQPGELGWWRSKHPGLLLHDDDGQLVADPDWPDEVLLDTSTANKRAGLARIVGRWVRGCADRGFDAVESDNLDSWTRSDGRLTRAGNIALARSLVRTGHRAGLSMGQKNAAEAVRAGRRTARFDFATAEECEVYRECGAYRRVYKRHLIEIEYTDNGKRAFRRACAKRGHSVSVLLRDRDVVRRGADGYVSRWC